LLILPDVVTLQQAGDVAGFREDAQALRVTALEAGVEVELALPPHAKAGVYSEHSAEWVMPLFAFLGSGAASVGWNLTSNVIQRKLDLWRASGQTRTPEVRFRELVVPSDGGPWRVREIEGPADAVIGCLRELVDQADDAARRDE
jgi:hypothetical protein